MIHYYKVVYLYKCDTNKRFREIVMEQTMFQPKKLSFIGVQVNRHSAVKKWVFPASKAEFEAWARSK